MGGPGKNVDCDSNGSYSNSNKAGVFPCATVAKRRIGRANQETPSWLDASFLFRLNYGPATREDVLNAKLAIGGICYEDRREKREERSRVTLLDRGLAHKLYQALFPSVSAESIFATDPSPDLGVDSMFGIRLTPFDYDQNDPTVYPLIWTESFIVNCVWNDHYSSTVLGKNNRPSMSAIVFDMIALLDHLQARHESQTTIYSVLFDFANSPGVQSCRVGAPKEWAAKGIFADIFNLVACVHYLGRAEPKSKVLQQTAIMGQDWHEGGGPRRWPERNFFPGCDALRLPKLSYRETGNVTPLDALSAEFICSGPFKLTFTTRLAEHLTFNQNREIRLFFDGDFVEFNYPGFPGQLLKPFEQHALGRILEADTLYEEVSDTYSLLFSRSRKSKEIARSLFQTQGFEVKFTNNPYEDAAAADSRPARRRGRWPSTESIQLDRRRVINILQWEVYGSIPTVDSFHHFRSHIVLLEKKMMDWHPQTIRDLFSPGYRDRFTFYTAYFGLFIALFAALTLILVTLQLIISSLAWKFPVAPSI